MNSEVLDFIKDKLIEYNKAFESLKGDDFLTFGYICTSEDGMGMLHSYSIHSFKTLDGLVEYIYKFIEETGENPDIGTVSEWFENNLSFNEEVGKYIAYIDSFIEGNLKVTDKFYDAIKANDDDAYNEVMSSLTEEEQDIWQISSYLEDQDTDLAKLDDKSFITVAYIHTTEDSAGMMTAGGYTNFKTLGDAAEYINELYEDDSFDDEDPYDWCSSNVTIDADESRKYAVYIRSFED